MILDFKYLCKGGRYISVSISCSDIHALFPAFTVTQKRYRLTRMISSFISRITAMISCDK